MDDFKLLLAICVYLLLAICYISSDHLHLKLAITCKNLFPFPPAVRLVIFKLKGNRKCISPCLLLIIFHLDSNVFKHIQVTTMASEDNILKKIMDLQAIFLNKHKLPTLFTFQLKHSLIILDLKHVMAKFGWEFKIWTTCSQSHKTKITMVREVGKSSQFYTSKKNTNETSCWPRAPGLQEFVAVGFSQNFERVLEEWWKEEVVR